MKSKSDSAKILKAVLILAVSTLWLVFAIYCWQTSSEAPSGAWFDKLMDLLRDTPSKFSVYTYLSLAGFPLFAFYLTVLLPDLIRRFFDLKGRALLTFRILIIALICFAGFAAVIGCLKSYTAPGFLEPFYANVKAVNALRLLNSYLTPVSLLLILFTWFLPVLILFMKDASKSHSVTPAKVRNVLIFYALLIVLNMLLTSGTAVLLSFVKLYSKSATGVVLTMMSKSATDVTALFQAIVLAPIIEEVAFRGLIQHHLKRTLPAGISLMITSVCFGLWHRNLAQFIYCAATAVIWGLIYNATGKLRHTILLHFLSNLLATMAYSADSKALLGKYVVLPAIRKWMMDLSLFPAILMLLLHAVLIFIVVKTALYFAVDKEKPEKISFFPHLHFIRDRYSESSRKNLHSQKLCIR